MFFFEIDFNMQRYEKYFNCAQIIVKKKLFFQFSLDIQKKIGNFVPQTY